MRNLFSLNVCLLLFYIYLQNVDCEEDCKIIHRTEHGFHVDRKRCPVFCCGDCDSRYCCSEDSKRTDPNEDCIDSCRSYKDDDAQFILEQKCPPNKPFCCGSCGNRNCCDELPLRLEQNDCGLDKGNHMTIWLLVLMSIGAFGILLLLAFSIAWCVIFVLKKNSLNRNKSSSRTAIIPEPANQQSQPEQPANTSANSIPTISGPLPYRNPNDDNLKNEHRNRDENLDRNRDEELHPPPYHNV